MLASQIRYFHGACCVEYRGECPLRFRLKMGGSVFSGAIPYPYPCAGLFPGRTGLDRSLVECTFLQVGSRLNLVPNADLSVGTPVPPRLNGPSHRWFDTILGGWPGASNGGLRGLAGWIGVCVWGHRSVV